MFFILRLLGMLLLFVTLLTHGLSIFTGSTQEFNQNIYAFQGKQEELTLNDISKIHNHVRYLVYFFGVVLLWSTINGFIHYFFMFVALSRYVVVATASRKQTEYSKNIDKMANVAAMVHVAYVLVVVIQ